MKELLWRRGQAWWTFPVAEGRPRVRVASSRAITHLGSNATTRRRRVKTVEEKRPDCASGSCRGLARLTPEASSRIPHLDPQPSQNTVLSLTCTLLHLSIKPSAQNTYSTGNFRLQETLAICDSGWFIRHDVNRPGMPSDET